MIDDLIDFYRRIGLPRSLIELGLDAIERKTLVHVAANVTQAPAGAYLVVPYTADEIVAAMQNVEARFAPIAGDAIHA
jgi:glycerol dehydrogenase